MTARRWVARNPLAVVTLVGILLYGIVRLANALFYGELGVTPEEVGVGYQETLAQSALTVVLITLFFAVGLGALSLWYLVVLVGLPRLFAWARRRLWKQDFARGKARLERVRWRRAETDGHSRRLLGAYELILRLEYEPEGVRLSRRVVGRVAAVSVVGAVAVTTAVLILSARGWGSEASHGDPVQRARLFGIPLLHIRAESADAASTDGTPLSALGIDGDRCYLYLGESGGTTYLYTYDEEHGVGRTLRVGSDQITVSTPSRSGDCPPS